MAKKIAACHCAPLKLVCEGKPMFVAMCHCQDCQRRTGSSYNLGVWYNKTAVAIRGNDKIFRRVGEEGMELAFHFCSVCGSNVYWEASGLENELGVAGGAFADPDLPKPTVSLYDKRRHRWLQIPDNIPCHITGIGSDEL